MNDTFQTAEMRYTSRKVSGPVKEDLVYLSTSLILDAAQALGVSYKELPETRIFELQYQDHIEHFHAQIPSKTTEVGFYACLDKNVTKALLMHAGIQVPHGFRLSRSDSKEYWKEVFDTLTKPLVVKPTHANQGRGVYMNIDTYEKYEAAVKEAFEVVNDEFAGVIVEQTFAGKEYRILATKEKILGIICRVPANVVGNGVSTIGQLIDQKNADPRRSERSEDALLKIPVDGIVREHLASQNLTLDSVPEKDQQIFLRLNSNISTGGDSIDMTDQAHPSVHEIGLKIMRAIPGLALGGIDFMTTDITAPQTSETYTIVEVNSSPGLSIHDVPYLGTPRNTAKECVLLMFPELRNK